MKITVAYHVMVDYTVSSNSMVQDGGDKSQCCRYFYKNRFHQNVTSYEGAMKKPQCGDSVVKSKGCRVNKDDPFRGNPLTL